MQDEVMNDLHEVYTDQNPNDLVRVTRCKYCVHRQPNEQKYMCMLTITEQNCKEIYMGDNDYCSYGERKDE